MVLARLEPYLGPLTIFYSSLIGGELAPGMLAVVGALVNAPVPHVCAFIAYTFITTYLIYGVPRLGRLWVWVQIPTVTAFYLVLFDHRGLGWDNAQMFAGLAIAVAMLWLFNNVIWPEPAAAVLSGSIRSTLERSRRRLELLMRIFLAEGGATPNHDRGVASKVAYHLTLLEPSIHNAANVREPAELLAAVTVAERIHNEIDRAVRRRMHSARRRARRNRQVRDPRRIARARRRARGAHLGKRWHQLAN